MDSCTVHDSGSEILSRRIYRGKTGSISYSLIITHLTSDQWRSEETGIKAATTSLVTPKDAKFAKETHA